MYKSIATLCAASVTLALFCATLAGDGASAAADQAQTIKRTPLQRFDLPDSGYETIIGIAEVAPNVLIGRHTHPGPESGYVIEGSITLLIDGQAPVMLQAGDSYMVPSRAIHDAQTGPDGAKVIATYIIEKGQPIASPAE